MKNTFGTQLCASESDIHEGKPSWIGWLKFASLDIGIVHHSPYSDMIQVNRRLVILWIYRGTCAGTRAREKPADGLLSTGLLV
jgi:hypothetical protein